jgi:hypothetical protein
MFTLWFSFFCGVFIRLGDRIEHSIAATVGPSESIKTPWDYLKLNCWKISLRLFAGMVSFWILLDLEPVGKITALLAGFTFETAVESLQQRATRNGQSNGKVKE